jgi:hypothetical protein
MKKLARKGVANGVAAGLVDPANGLSLRQSKVLDALAAGEVPARVAIACEVSRVTIYQWLKRDDFRSALEARREQLSAAMADRLASLAEAALAAVTDFLRSDGGELDIEPAKVTTGRRVLVGLGLLGGKPADRD